MAHQKSADPNVFILPDLGEGVHEAELIKWRVAVGQAVNEHDILAEMETDKALVEVPSPRTGVIKQLHGTEGEVLHVGNPLVSYEGAGAATVAPGGTAPVGAALQSGASSKPEPSSNGSAHAEVAEDAGTVVGQMSASAAGVSAAPGKALATPAVRRLARDLGLDIDTLTGTGIGGRVLEKDVRTAASGAKPAPAARAATQAPAPRTEPVPSLSLGARSDAAPRAAAPAPKPAPSFPAGQDTVRIPFRGVRRTIANRLRESVNRAVHFNVMDEADISTLDSLRKKLGAASGEKLSVLPFVASAVCRVLSRPEFRAMNATVEETDAKDADAFIIQHRAVHIGIATDTDSGLMVPVIRDCDALGVLEIGRQIAAIAGAARSRTIPREQLMGSTFTISNVGSHAGRFATPIINYPEVAILAVGRARHSPVVRHGGLFVGNLLPLSLACDHRVVDGATAALALAEIVKLLQEHPDTLMGPARG